MGAEKARMAGFIWCHLLAVTTALLVALLMIVVLWPYVVITVPSGRVGVYWKRINTPDFYCWCFIWPWDKLFIYDLRLQSSSQTINAISKDGARSYFQIHGRRGLYLARCDTVPNSRRPGFWRQVQQG